MTGYVPDGPPLGAGGAMAAGNGGGKGGGKNKGGPTPEQKAVTPCRFHREGTCKKGAECDWLHDDAPDAQAMAAKGGGKGKGKTKTKAQAKAKRIYETYYGLGH